MITDLRDCKEFADPVMIKKAVRKGTQLNAPTLGPPANARVNSTPEFCKAVTMPRFVNHARHEFWWWAEQRAGKLWHRVCADGISCWLDWLPSFCTRRRYAAQRALHPDSFARR